MNLGNIDWSDNNLGGVVKAALGAVAACFGWLVLKHRQPPVQEVQPVGVTREFREVADRIESAVNDLHELSGRLDAYSEDRDQIFSLASRMGAVEGAQKSIEQVQKDTNSEMHEIKHRLNNIDQKLTSALRITLSKAQGNGH